MFAWSDVETGRDPVDFSKVDRALTITGKKRGKEIQLVSRRVAALGNQRRPPAGVGIPAYLLELLPASEKQVPHRRWAFVHGRRCTEFDFSGAAGQVPRDDARHFSDQRPLTLIDLRGFGLWGSGIRDPLSSLEVRRDALKTIIDHWCSAFPMHNLAISYSHDPDGPPAYYSGPADHFDPAHARTYADFLRYSH